VRRTKTLVFAGISFRIEVALFGFERVDGCVPVGGGEQPKTDLSGHSLGEGGKPITENR
jgi:hypothetical protein